MILKVMLFTNDQTEFLCLYKMKMGGKLNAFDALICWGGALYKPQKRYVPFMKSLLSKVQKEKF